MQREVASLALAPTIKAKLIGAGFVRVGDLHEVSAAELRIEAGISLQESTEVLQTVFPRSHEKGSETRWMKATEILEQEKSCRSISTFCAALDTVLGGGIMTGKMIEICGTPGVGKTQLCIQLAVNTQIPASFGGVEGHSVYIDTEGSFLVDRVVDVAEAALQHCKQQHGKTGQLGALENFTLETILSNIFFFRCHDYVELLAQVHLLPDFLFKHPKVRFLVVDSIAYPFRHEFEDLSVRTRLLHGLAQKLLQLASQHNIAIVLTNHMTIRLEQNNSALVPALGESWGHVSPQRLVLYWQGKQRFASLTKSSRQKEQMVPFQITSHGFHDVQLFQSQVTASISSATSNTTTVNARKRCRVEDDDEHEDCL
ncbi:DNA repair protein RAD51 homolog 3 [Erpetoichthys calabaricus]|uniref:DNA repair protein RAD51 homolog 3 n=1 Tax=Erpetoichthys calabaricus TaxID=27687 RepID=A0A8C4SMG4_ERPCA|nr:DNA repair protein RAD51 homolog 3 [Erpetoichthys calabaricus]